MRAFGGYSTLHGKIPLVEIRPIMIEAQTECVHSLQQNQTCNWYLAQWHVHPPCIWEVLRSNLISLLISLDWVLPEDQKNRIRCLISLDRVIPEDLVGSFCFPARCTAFGDWVMEMWGRFMRCNSLSNAHGPQLELFPGAKVQPWASCSRPSFPSVMIMIVMAWA